MATQNAGTNYGFCIRTTHSPSTAPIETKEFKKIYHEGMLGDTEAMANLATALGVSTAYKGVISNLSDLDELTQNGQYWIDVNQWYGNLINIIGKGNGGYNRRLQIWWNSNGNEVKIRNYYLSTWGNWSRVDNFGCSTPEALASLMGVTVRFCMLTNSSPFVLTNVPRGCLAYISYEYSNVYSLGYLGNPNYNKISGTLFDSPVSGNTLSISWNRPNNTLTLTTSGGSFGLVIVLLGTNT